jgi:hypothetical protein
MSRIVVVEYPKSGGSWFVSLLGDALSLPKRDIYVYDGYNIFDVTKHPWYEGVTSLGLTESCIIKSHELPVSSLHNFQAKFIHLVRDGRDVIISKYFYERDFCVQNGIYSEFDVPFDEYVERISIEWRNFVLAWLEIETVTCQYEELLKDPFSTLHKVFSLLGIKLSDDKINQSILANTKDKMKKSLDKAFKYNTFVRKGIIGDWRNYFNEDHKESFKKCAGDVLIRLGYEHDKSW